MGYEGSHSHHLTRVHFGRITPKSPRSCHDEDPGLKPCLVALPGQGHRGLCQTVCRLSKCTSSTSQGTFTYLGLAFTAMAMRPRELCKSGSWKNASGRSGCLLKVAGGHCRVELVSSPHYPSSEGSVCSLGIARTVSVGMGPNLPLMSFVPSHRAME